MTIKNEQRTVVSCSFCKKDLILTVSDYNRRKKKNQNGWMLHSECVGPMKQAQNPDKIIKIKCGQCGIEREISLKKWRWRSQNNKTEKFFCSTSCGAKYSMTLNHPWKSGTQEKIDAAKNKPIKKHKCSIPDCTMEAWYSSGDILDNKIYTCEKHEYIIVKALKESQESWLNALMIGV